MAQNVVVQTLQDIAVNAVAQGIVQATGIPARLAGGNEMVQALVNGFGFSLVNDAVVWFYSGDSKVLNGDWMSITDEGIYNAMVQYLLMMADVDIMVAQAIADNSPLTPEMNQALTLGTIAVGTNSLRDFVDRNAGSNLILNRIVHPTRILF